MSSETMTSAPTAPTAMPTQIARDGGSPSSGPLSDGDESGWEATSATEVTIDVSFTDAIQKAKCRAMKTPASSAERSIGPRASGIRRLHDGDQQQRASRRGRGGRRR